MPLSAGGLWTGMINTKMGNKEQFYWKGVHFPGTLNEAELEQWLIIKEEIEGKQKELTPEQEQFWSYMWLIYVIVLCTIAFIAV